VDWATAVRASPHATIGGAGLARWAAGSSISVQFPFRGITQKHAGIIEILRHDGELASPESALTNPSRHLSIPTYGISPSTAALLSPVPGADFLLKSALKRIVFGKHLEEKYLKSKRGRMAAENPLSSSLFRNLDLWKGSSPVQSRGNWLRMAAHTWDDSGFEIAQIT
jgi:hypothetical protein